MPKLSRFKWLTTDLMIFFFCKLISIQAQVFHVWFRFIIISYSHANSIKNNNGSICGWLRHQLRSLLTPNLPFTCWIILDKYEIYLHIYTSLFKSSDVQVPVYPSWSIPRLMMTCRPICRIYLQVYCSLRRQWISTYDNHRIFPFRH